MFTPLDDHSDGLNDLSSRIQRGLGQIAVFSDAAHALGANRVVRHTGKGSVLDTDGQDSERKYVGAIANLSSFSFHAVNTVSTSRLLIDRGVTTDLMHRRTNYAA